MACLCGVPMQWGQWTRLLHALCCALCCEAGRLMTGVCVCVFGSVDCSCHANDGSLSPLLPSHSDKAVLVLHLVAGLSARVVRALSEAAAAKASSDHAAHRLRTPPTKARTPPASPSAAGGVRGSVQELNPRSRASKMATPRNARLATPGKSGFMWPGLPSPHEARTTLVRVEEV